MLGLSLRKSAKESKTGTVSDAKALAFSEKDRPRTLKTKPLLSSTPAKFQEDEEISFEIESSRSMGVRLDCAGRANLKIRLQSNKSNSFIRNNGWAT